jgi:signal transduction histidine kinase
MTMNPFTDISGPGATEVQTLPEPHDARNGFITANSHGTEMLSPSAPAVLDAIGTPLAVVAEDGTIHTVNLAWQEFARTNGFRWLDFAPGGNYLNVCDLACGHLSEGSRPVAAGIRAVLAGTRPMFQWEYPCHRPTEPRWYGIRVAPVRGGPVCYVTITHTDITKLKLLEQEHARTQSQLAATQRPGGVGAAALGALHNVGNGLNSINVTAGCLKDRTRTSKITKLVRLAELLSTRQADLVEFLTKDRSGQQVPAYLTHLTDHLIQEQSQTLEELTELQQHLDHVKNIVAQHLGSARPARQFESLSAADTMDTALKLAAENLRCRNIAIAKNYQPAPAVCGNKDAVLQILVNLLNNAAQAFDAQPRDDKKIQVAISPGVGTVRITVTDNGGGIHPEHLDRIFSHGFTTKPHGHGFGLHASAATAREMLGHLTVHSAGVGTGASFTLELPAVVIAPPQR